MRRGVGALAQLPELPRAGAVTRRRFRRIGGAWTEIPARRRIVAAVLAWYRKRREDKD